MAITPAVSVVVGAYNAERFVAEMIESLLRQTFSDFEFIVVDDGSRDGTLSILREYEKSDRRMRVIANPHGGIVDAANTGLEAAKAPLIARADADDIDLPQRLAKQVQYMADHPECVALGAQRLMIEPYGSPLGASQLPSTHEQIDAELLRGNGWALPQAVAMLRRKPVMQLGGYRKQYEWSEDLDLFLRLAEVGRLANLPDVLLKYRVHPQSTNHTRAHLQATLTRQCILETYHRRGLPPPADLNLYAPATGPDAERFRSWAWAALRDKNITGARKHALRALRMAPLSLNSWRATFCALRGY